MPAFPRHRSEALCAVLLCLVALVWILAEAMAWARVPLPQPDTGMMEPLTAVVVERPATSLQVERWRVDWARPLRDTPQAAPATVPLTASLMSIVHRPSAEGRNEARALLLWEDGSLSEMSVGQRYQGLELLAVDERGCAVRWQGAELRLELP